MEERLGNFAAVAKTWLEPQHPQTQAKRTSIPHNPCVISSTTLPRTAPALCMSPPLHLLTPVAPTAEYGLAAGMPRPPSSAALSKPAALLTTVLALDKSPRTLYMSASPVLTRRSSSSSSAQSLARCSSATIDGMMPYNFADMSLATFPESPRHTPLAHTIRNKSAPLPLACQCRATSRNRPPSRCNHQSTQRKHGTTSELWHG